MNIRRHLLACLLAFFTSACSFTTDITRAMMPPSSSDARIDVLYQTGRIMAMSATELTAEADNLQKAFSARRSEDNRFRLALFLAIAPPPQGDRFRAQNLMDVAASETNGRGRSHPLAQLLLPLLQDNHRLNEALATGLQKQRELQQNNEAMRQKLEAISNIELKMQERPKTK